MMLKAGVKPITPEHCFRWTHTLSYSLRNKPYKTERLFFPSEAVTH